VLGDRVQLERMLISDARTADGPMGAPAKDACPALADLLARLLGARRAF
jgi:hypothetical protein